MREDAEVWFLEEYFKCFQGWVNIWDLKESPFSIFALGIDVRIRL